MSGIEHSICKPGYLTPLKGGNRASAAVPARLISIGGSAGALGPLLQIISALAPGGSTAIAVALHGSSDQLQPVLAHHSPLPVRWASPAQPLAAGVIDVAPPRQHLIVNPDATISLSTVRTRAPYWPSVDWLFESAAATFGEDHIAVVLSGAMNDGARGVRAVRRLGGTVIVQDPASCESPDMPLAASVSGVTTFAPLGELTRVVHEFADSADAGDCVRRLSTAACDLMESRVRLHETIAAIRRTVDGMPRKGDRPPS